MRSRYSKLPKVHGVSLLIRKYSGPYVLKKNWYRSLLRSSENVRNHSFHVFCHPLGVNDERSWTLGGRQVFLFSVTSERGPIIPSRPVNCTLEILNGKVCGLVVIVDKNDRRKT